METASWFLFLLVLVASIHYLYYVVRDKFYGDGCLIASSSSVKEGFTTEEDSVDKVVSTGDQWLDNTSLYDTFYASVYDQLVQGAARTQGEVGVLYHMWTRDGTVAKDMKVLDTGCGTGLACIAFANMNVQSVLGVDSSEAMLKRAQNVNISKSKLSEEQKKLVSFRQADLMNPSALGGAEVTHACCLYFTIYYMKDLEAFFRNMYLWVKPGGMLSVEVVNKHKFDPMLESAAPWLAFSLQKYSKDRVTKSEVTFDKFVYSGQFELTDPSAEFRETFRFKDGKIRRQRHRFLMPDIEDIVKTAKMVGWNYIQFTDLTTVGFEYAYLLHFRRP